VAKPVVTFEEGEDGVWRPPADGQATLDDFSQKHVDAAQTGMSDARRATQRRAGRGGRGRRRAAPTTAREKGERGPRS
jgi:hypothetical protein